MHLDRQADLTGWLPLAACIDRPANEVGRKARQLALAGRQGLRTPGGHVLPAQAFWAMLDAHGLASPVRYLASAALTLDPAHTLAIARDVAAALAAASVDTIAARHAEALFPEPPAATLVCRSSAAMEDGTDAAFPGMFLSVLHIGSADALAQAIAACWRSVFGPDLIRYMLRMRPAAIDFSLALLVQPQVAAVWYGVCFGADPVGDRPGMVAELTDLAPDALVGGAPARLRFAWGHGRWHGDAPPPAGLDQLPDVVARLSGQVGAPVDVEFALNPGGGAPIVLQARPISILGRKTVRVEPAGVLASIPGQGCAPGVAAGCGGGDIALVAAVDTRDYARVLDARAMVAAADTSPLGHVAILCRELGVPLVAGVGAALERLPGEPLLVDGDAGRVLLLSDHPVEPKVAIREGAKSDAVLGIDELMIRLLVASDPGDPAEAALRAIIRDRRRALGAARVRIVGAEPAPELAALLTPEQMRCTRALPTGA